MSYGIRRIGLCYLIKLIIGRSSLKILIIGQLHDDDIWPQLPGFISVLLCYLNLSIPLRIEEQ